MKLSIPAATFATLLAGKSVPSKSDTILYTELATKTGSDIDIELLRRSYEEKFRHLKQKAKARIESKKRLLLAFHEFSREAFLATTEKLCDPIAAATDLGILDNSCLPNQFCIEDSASELGGVCAKVVVRKIDNPGVEGRGVNVEDGVVAKGSRDGDIVGVMKQKTQVRVESESKDKLGGDEYMAAVDGGDYNDGGYKDNRYGDVDGGYKVNRDIYNVSVESTDEGVQGFGDSAKAVFGSKLLKPSSMHDIWKAGHILERSRAGSEVHSSLVGGECNPGTNDGYVDVGIFNGCSYGYFCRKDPYSYLGGTCVNIGSTADMSHISRDFHEGGTHRHLLACAYLNGTSGEKCSGMMACDDLSPDFIANRIGCGSCNAYGACRGLTATSSVGEGSCNGGNACRYSNTTVGASFSTALTLTVNDQSCNQYYACSYGRGFIYISDNSCDGVYACMGLTGNSTIGKESCNKDGACKDLSGNTTIGFNSCGDCYSCESTSGTTTITDQSCNELKACSETSGVTAIANQSCNAQYSCSSTSEITVIGRGSCNKARACSNVAGTYAFFGPNCCNGELACEGATSANMTVLQDSCNMKEACRGSSGDDILIDGGCTGDGACSNLVANYVRIYSGACNAAYSCSVLSSGIFFIGTDSCSRPQACQEMTGIVSIGSSSCSGNRACSESSGHLTIHESACLNDYACLESSGHTWIESLSCNSRSACRNVSGNTTIHSSSCNGASACRLAHDYTIIYSNSCNAEFGCWDNYGNVVIHSNSCSGTFACSKLKDNTTIQSLSCNFNDACWELYGTSFVASGSCNAAAACDYFGEGSSSMIGATSCNYQLACNYLVGTTIIDQYSCSGLLACSHDSVSGAESDVAIIGKGSCNASYACYNLRDYSYIADGSCDSPRSCSELSLNSTIGMNSCISVNACRESKALVVDSNSCVGDDSCSYMNGWAQVYAQSCLGVNACSRLYHATILGGSCVGVGACSRPSDHDNSTDMSAFTVGTGSCSGCYACIKSTADSSVTIGNDSCLGFSVCEELSGNVTIGDQSCYGLKACSNSSEYSTIEIDSQSCVGARSCMSMSGNSVVSNSSCVEPQACRYMNNANIGYHSCIGRESCFGLEGTVNSWSCQGFSSCKNAHHTASSNQIGQNSCNAAYACQNNTAVIGDCLCLSENECKNNVLPMDYDGCAPSLSPSPTSSISPTDQLSKSPSFSPSSSLVPSSSSTASTRPSPTPFDLSLSPSGSPSEGLPICSPAAKKIKIESTTQENIQLIEVMIMSNGINVAMGKTASQSSSWVAPWNGLAFDASRAVDGSEGKWSFSKTNDSSAWWEIDLGSLHSIESVNIKNRWCQDTSDPRGCLCDLSEATVTMLDEYDVPVASASTLNTCGMLDVHPNLPPPCDSYCLPNARKVKIEQTSTGQPIQIFQLHVSSSGIDVAQGKNATQSSTWVAKWNGKSFNASNAVDGKPMTYSRTNDDPNAWLEVDLGGNFAVGSLDILNRWCKDLTDPENCLCKLSGATILLIDDSGDETTSISIGDTCGKAHLEYVLDPSPEFCLVSEGSNTMDFSPSRQLIRQPWHNRVLRKRPTKC